MLAILMGVVSKLPIISKLMSIWRGRRPSRLLQAFFPNRARIGSIPSSATSQRRPPENSVIRRMGGQRPPQSDESRLSAIDRRSSRAQRPPRGGMKGAAEDFDASVDLHSSSSDCKGRCAARALHPGGLDCQLLSSVTLNCNA